jgi:hypothetical protein
MRIVTERRFSGGTRRAHSEGADNTSPELSMRHFGSVLKLALCALLFAATASPSLAQVSLGVGIGVSINVAPPAIPVYVQPPCPAPNYIWTPGYWAWGSAGYYWVPGTWVAAPQPGYLWTPGYWAWHGGYYGWHGGYWATSVGYYGGVNYGFGYIGRGYVGGGWYGGAFRYNTAVTNVNTTVINNTYVDKTVIVNNDNTTVNRVSYNGGPGGLTARPTPEELAVRQQPHLPATPIQKQNQHIAGQDRNSYAAFNHGAPLTAAVAHPLSAENRPAGFEHVTPEDRAAAQSHVVTHGAFTAESHASTMTTHPSGSTTYHPNETYHSNQTYHPNETYHAPAGSHPQSSHPEPEHPPKAPPA